jgi:ribose transport system substrate-binding protein
MRKHVVLAALAAATLAVSGCGDSDSESSGAAASGDSGGGSQTFVADAKAQLEKDREGTDRPLPTEPVKALRDKKIFAIPCTSGGPGCQLPAENFRDAAKTLGWDVTIADGKGTPQGQSAAVDAAIAANADAIVLVAVDCQNVKAALERADKAKIPVYAMISFDCDEPDGAGGEKLFDAAFAYEGGSGLAEFYDTLWNTVANYVIAETDGKGKVLHVQTSEPLLAKLSIPTFKTAMEKCTTCTVYETHYSLDDLLAGKVEAKVTAALTAHPDVDAVVAPYGAAVTLGVGNAVEAARRNGGKDIILAAIDGLGDNYKLIQKGVQTMDTGSQPVRWWGWIATDGLLRLFNDQPQVDSGQGMQVITKENVPSDGLYDGNPKSSGYEQNYKKLWGVE